MAPTLASSIAVLKCTCDVVPLVQCYQAAVLSYQLVVKLAQMSEAKLRKEVMFCSSCCASGRDFDSLCSSSCRVVLRRRLQDLQAEALGPAGSGAAAGHRMEG